MKKLKAWFIELTRIGKLSVISALALGGIFVASATTPPSSSSVQPVQLSAPVVQEEKKPVVTTKIETETQDIPFEVQSIEDDSLAKGTSSLKTAGIKGIKTITHTITMTDGVETSRNSFEAVTTQPVNEVTAIGTYVAPVPKPSNCDPNYSGCVPIVSYDLDCKDVGYRVTVIGYDKHRLDGDHDGYGCESY